MKNVILSLLTLFSIAFASAQTVSYNSSNDIFANPERGLQKYSKNLSSSGTYNLLDQTTLTNWRTGSDKVTVVYRYLMLTPYMNSTIDATYLANVQTDLNRVRAAGMKIIIRPAYTTDYIANVQPNKAQIINHIAQLAPVINANKDVILSIQAGFIGVYGEWYYTGGTTNSDSDGSPEFGDKGNISSAQWLNRKEIVDAMLSNFTGLPVQVRHANAKRQMYGNTQLTDATAYQNTPVARVGFYNDAFLNEDGDMGTYDVSNCTNPVGTADFNFIANAAQYLPMNGESNGINPCNSGFRITGANAVNELNLLNFSTLNRDYHPGVWDGWIASGHYNEIVRNLGYRLQLDSTTVNVGTTIDFTMNISNVGYANVLSAKNVYLVFRSTTGTEYKKLLNVDPRLWKTTHSYSQSLTRDIPVGQYSLYLHIADPNLESRSEYSIRLANSDITFETTTGYNNLNQTINITALVASCTVPTVWNGTSWSLGAPSLSVAAQIDGPYVATDATSFSTCDLTVNSTLTINDGAYVEVLNDIVVDPAGTLLVQSGGKLIPKSDTSTSTGIVSVERTTPQLKMYDYTYWSSPVNTTINTALLPTNWWMNYSFTFETQNFYDIQTQLGTTITPGADGQDDDGDAWLLINPTSNFVAGKGYASMVHPSGTFPRTETVTFTGTLNTGIITYPMVLSGNDATNDDDFNLVGNPYSASIFANNVINTNINNISGTLIFWSHAGTLSSSYPGLVQLNFSPNDYAYYNLSGGTRASLFGGKTPIGYIGTGQGFMVQAENAADLEFKPSFMATGYLNGDITFFRSSNVEAQKKRAWVSISTELELFAQQLINYTENTTLGYEKGWDFKQPEGRLAVKFYSIQDSIKYKIQARGEFNIEDVVKVGYFSAIPETYTIHLDSIEGIENIYIRDNGQVHTLPYTFVTEAGEFNDRFEIIYQNSLTTPGNVKNDGLILYPNPAKNKVNINFDELQSKPILYNALGQVLKASYKIENNTIVYEIEELSNGLYFIKVNNVVLRLIKE